MAKYIKILTLVLIALMMLAACGGGTAETPEEVPAEAPTEEAAATVALAEEFRHEDVGVHALCLHQLVHSLHGWTSECFIVPDAHPRNEIMLAFEI